MARIVFSAPPVDSGQTRSFRTHASYIRAFRELVPGRSVEMAAASPGSRLADKDGILGGPGRPLDFNLHPWVAWQGEQAWDIAAKALRPTRQLLVEDRLASKRREKLAAKKKQWRLDQTVRTASGRKPASEPKSVRLTAAEREAAASAVRPVTMADYLYRLRIKANYQDVTVFSDGPSSDHEATEVEADLVALASATLLVHELRIAAIIGMNDLVKAMDAVLLHASGGSTGGLAHRRDLHAGLS